MALRRNEILKALNGTGTLKMHKYVCKYFVHYPRKLAEKAHATDVEKMIADGELVVTSGDAYYETLTPKEKKKPPRRTRINLHVYKTKDGWKPK